MAHFFLSEKANPSFDAATASLSVSSTNESLRSLTTVSEILLLSSLTTDSTGACSITAAWLILLAITVCGVVGSLVSVGKVDVGERGVGKVLGCGVVYNRKRQPGTKEEVFDNQQSTEKKIATDFPSKVCPRSEANILEVVIKPDRPIDTAKRVW
jgi:hypothetical protein